MADTTDTTDASESTETTGTAETAEVPFRILPKIDEGNRFFWTSGGDGRLRFLRCQNCGYYIHPPLPLCPRCHSKRLEPEAVSGRATVATFSINYQPWMPGPELPYVVAIVEIEEQPEMRLTTNIVNCAPDAVRAGLAVRVVFECHPDEPDDVYLPLFEPRQEER
jgi:uncharacterized OB-fold protein